MKKIVKERGSIYCGTTAWEVLKKTIVTTNYSQLIILVDSHTKKHCLPVLAHHLPQDMSFHTITIPAGEDFKSIKTCTSVWQDLSDLEADRNSVLINLGGGVVTDLGGFIASTFKRGIEFINIPTSLLAMVDASVGGKNGVDLGHLKNQIGVIRNPLSVFIFVEFLTTLPPAQVTSGYAEMLKHGLISSENYWNSLQDFNVADHRSTENYIWESVEIKNAIVTKDPAEKNIRKTLNYGHTLGHAIESYFLENKSVLLHGEAIAIGMILTNFISSKLKGFPKHTLERTTKTILCKYRRVDFTEDDIDQIIQLLKYDKKNTNGQINFVLLENFNCSHIDQQVSNDLIRNAFAFYKNFKI